MGQITKSLFPRRQKHPTLYTPRHEAAARWKAVYVNSATTDEERLRGLALQLRFLRSSESIGHHDSEIVDDGYFDRDDAGALGVIAAGCQSADGAIVHPGAGGGFCWLIPGRTTRRRAAQDRLD